MHRLLNKLTQQLILHSFGQKTIIVFYHTLRQENKAVARDTLVPVYKQSLDLVHSAQTQIGSKLIPDYPIQSSTEAYYFLKKSQNLNSLFHKHVHSLNMNGREYLDHKFVMCFDCEKINGHTAAFTGMKNKKKNGEQITLKCYCKVKIQQETLKIYT